MASISPIKTPWTAALLALLVIWSVWLLAGPSGISSSPPSTSLPDTLSSNQPLSDQPLYDTPSKPGQPPSELSGGYASDDGTEDAWRNAGATKSPTADTPAKSTAPATSSNNSPAGGLTDRPLILIAFSETAIARANLKFFIAHGLHDAADFMFIINGESKPENDVTAKDLLPKGKANIKYVERPNDCYDLGAYAEVLTKDDLYKKYKHFITLNTSLRGPFMPHWADNCWSDMYLKKLTDEVKLVGMTGNCWPKFHVQSMIWATDSIGMNLLLFPPQPKATTENPNPEKVLGINSCFHSWDTAVAAEIGATSVITDNGYKIDVMMQLFQSDEKYIEHCDSGGNGDVLWNGKYAGTNVHPYETIFLKVNRDIDPVLVERLTEWTDKANYTSYDHCKLA